MEQYGMIRVAAATPLNRVGDTRYNAEQTVSLIRRAHARGASLILFPELSVTAYSCGDLLLSSTLLRGTEQAVQHILDETRELDITAIIGLPVSDGARLYNCAAVLSKGSICGIVPKQNLPNYGEFYEARWFSPASSLQTDTVTLCGQQVSIGCELLFTLGDAKIGVEICEDLWVNSPPSERLAEAGANLICNLSASNAVIGKRSYRSMLVRQRSFCSHCAYLLASAGITESTTDTLYSGHSLIAENGSILAEAMQDNFEEQLLFADIDLERLSSDRRKMTTFPTGGWAQEIELPHGVQAFSLERRLSKTPFLPSSSARKDERMEEIYNIQSLSLAKRLRHTGLKHPVIGISGGLDSTLALLVTVRAMDKLGLDRSNVIGITLPGFGTSGRTLTNSQRLMAALGITSRQIDITEACLKHFEDIGHDPNVQDVTYENVQARERTQILLDIANKNGGLVVGTGDLSELALGWATYAGDHISMYGVNAGVPKTLVRHVVAWTGRTYGGEIEEILNDILDTPVSPELLPTKDGEIAQKTEEIIGDYILHDFFLYYFIRFGFTFDKILFLACHAFGEDYTKEQIKTCLTTFVRRFFSQQFKRSCLPDGPKIGSVTLSPRADWRMPSDCSAALWLEDLNGWER